MQDNKPRAKESTVLSKEEMLTILERSGYLLESEVARQLVERGYFVETNQVLKDPITGKSRELDLHAQYGQFDPTASELQAYVKVNLIFEVKNNLYPLVLLTPYTFSPYGDERAGLKQGQTGEGYQRGLDLDYFLTQWTAQLSQQTRFTQYCSFQRKNPANNKSEFMAIHPEELYAGLSKITQACEEQVDFWNIYRFKNHTTDQAHRNHLFLPVLLIKDELYELNVVPDGGHEFKKVLCSRLYFSYFHQDTPKTALVYIVTKTGLDEFIDDMLALEHRANDYLVTGLKRPFD